MTSTQRKLCWMLASFFSVLPAGGYSFTGEFHNQPLWVGASAKNNVLLALDDSGSMDFEVLFGTEHGMLYVDSDGLFSTSDGELNSDFANLYAYGYLFPNGYSSSYDNAKRMYNGFYAVPPVKAYAFARSSDYNNAFYDPNTKYDPWPSYGGFTFDNADVSATPFEPAASGAATSPGTMNLFANFTPSDTYWGFDILDSDMLCDDAGNSCGSTSFDRKTGFTYYPATYYLKDTSISFEYESKPIHTNNARLLEAEDGKIIDPFKTYTNLEAGAAEAREDEILDDAVAEASGGNFVGLLQAVPVGEIDALSDEIDDISASYAINIPGDATVKIWVRVYAPDESKNSFWVNLQREGVSYLEGDASLTTAEAGSLWSSDDEWNRLWDIPAPADGGWTTAVDWQWVEWAELDAIAGDYTMNFSRRERGAYFDQILVTTNLTYEPTGPLELLEPDGPIDCANPDPAYYELYVRNPELFEFPDGTGNNSIYSIGIDGSCLKEYQITGTDTNTFDNGSTDRTGVTVAEEKQNFANWFTYHRRRHQAMRGALAGALESINGIQTGLFWINQLDDVTMYDMDDDSDNGDLETFLTNHYSHVNRGGTPLRSALKHAGEQFKDTDLNIITEECQKNFALLFTDGYNSEMSVSGIEHEDQVADSPYADAYQDTLGDIAYKYYNDILRSGTGYPEGQVDVHRDCGTADASPMLDCNANLHMNTYTVSLGVEGTIFGESHFEVADAYDTPPTWPNVNQASDKRQVDDLYHAAVNGRGEMFNATSTAELEVRLNWALQDILKSVGSGSGVTFNTSSLQSSGTKLIYSTEFNSTNWTGNIRARKVSSNGAVGDAVWVDEDADPQDNDGVKHVLEGIAPNDRVIMTYGASDGVAFRYANLTDDQKADLSYGETSTDAADIQATIESRVDYIRGDDSNFSYRQRDYVMGDVVHSAPVYVGKPASNWPDKAPFGATDDRFSSYSNGSAEHRTPMIYVGANDGMLHGFHASGSSEDAGKESLAYIPNLVYSDAAGAGLHYLSDPLYKHRYYVDLTPVAQDVYIKRSVSDASAAWRTVLIGGLRGGGKGIFALDVSDPTEFTETDGNPADVVLWEFDGGADMGYMTSSPIVAMMPNGEWAAIFGNGYSSDNGDAVLFIVYIEKGIDGVWSASDYKTISVGDDTANGLSGVAVADTDGDRVADRIYAGDIEGNMWGFDVSSTDPADWGIAHETGSGNSKAPAPLFTATDSDGNPQPITGAPNLAFNTDKSDSNKTPNILVTFGTGQYLIDSDTTSLAKQSYYTVWDTSKGGLTRSDLEPRTLVTGSNGQLTMSGSDLSWNQDDGWYFDFLKNTVAEGERLTHKPLVVPDAELGPVAIFASVIPETADACNAGGRSNLYALPLLTGLNPDRAIADLDGDGDIDDADIGVGLQKEDLINEPNKLGNVLFGSKGKGKDVDVTETTLEGGSTREGRLGWHELIDQ